MWTVVVAPSRGSVQATIADLVAAKVTATHGKMVATGAGIGPVLPYLLGRSPVQFECLWIGSGPQRASQACSPSA